MPSFPFSLYLARTLLLAAVLSLPAAMAGAQTEDGPPAEDGAPVEDWAPEEDWAPAEDWAPVEDWAPAENGSQEEDGTQKEAVEDRGDNSAVWTIQIENDFFTQLTNTDRHYSNGLRISRLSPTEEVPGWLRTISRIPSAIGRNDIKPEQRWAFSIGHSIFTPDDTDAVALIPDDRPYAGWAYMGFSVHSVYDWPGGGGRQDVFSIEAGIVGPSALGEEAQNRYHELIGVELSNGWDNQLDDEPGLQLSFERKWRTPSWDLEATRVWGRRQLDFIPHVSASLGNIITDFGLGATLRYGRNLQNDFGPPRIRPGLPGSERFGQKGNFDWYVFGGVEGRAVARNVFLDGNTWEDSHRVDHRRLVMDAQLGIALIYWNTRLTYTHVFNSPEFNEQRQWDQFGALTLSRRF